jgi:hypothetical protein
MVAHFGMREWVGGRGLALARSIRYLGREIYEQHELNEHLAPHRDFLRPRSSEVLDESEVEESSARHPIRGVNSDGQPPTRLANDGEVS